MHRTHWGVESLSHGGEGETGTGPGDEFEDCRNPVDHAVAGAHGHPLEPYGSEPMLARAVERLVRQSNAGDLVLFGAYDGYEIVSFDDQIGAHGSAGGSQLHPFLIGPRGLGLENAVLEDARDLHAALMSKYST